MEDEKKEEQDERGEQGEKNENQPDAFDRIANSLEKVSKTLDGFLDLGVITVWMANFRTLHDTVKPETLETMKTMLSEYVSPAHAAELLQTEGLDNLDQKLKRVLTRQRFYEYLLFTHMLEKRLPGRFTDAEKAVGTWLKDLCHDRDFRLVHARQSAYYPEFSEVVNEALMAEAEAVRERGLGESEPEKVIEALRLGESMERAASKSRADNIYQNQYRNLPPDSDERRLYDAIAYKKRLAVPLSKDDFIHIWLNDLPDWRSDDRKNVN